MDVSVTIANDIAREVVFTDYNCNEDNRIEVCVSISHGKPVANICLASGKTSFLIGPDDIKEPDLLRSYAHTMLAAADEMERMGA